MNSRIKYATKLAFVHLTISILVACTAAWFVFKILYPWPFSDILGITKIFGMLICIDIICGPLLTFFVSNPKKSKKETYLDLTTIGCIQVSALLFGLYSVYEARPVAQIFEKDRFVLVQANEVQDQFFEEALPKFQVLPTMGILTLSIRKAKDSDERLKSLDLSLEGVEPSLRPNWWIEFNKEQRKNALGRAGSMNELFLMYPEEEDNIKEIIREKDIDITTIRFLPFVSLKNYEWTVLLDKDANILAYLPLDAFKKIEQSN